MRVLITGSAGFIGSGLALRLLERGDEVIGIDCLDDYYDVTLKQARLARTLEFEGYTDVCARIEDRDAVRDTFAKYQPQRVINLAAQAGVRYSIENPAAYVDSNLVGFGNILEGCRHNGIEHLVYASSSSVYGINAKTPFSEEDHVNQPISPYGATKAAGELLCHVYNHLYDLPIICLRFFTVYGPRQRPDLAIRKFTDLIFRGEEIPVFGDGTTKRDYTYVDDILDGVLKSMTYDRSSFDIFNLGESRTVELQFLISLIEKELGKKAKIKRLPLQPGDVPITYADLEKSKRLLGYNPMFPIEEGIKNFVNWYLGLKQKL